MGSTVDSLNQPLNITWDSSCLSCQEIDIYLYAPNSPLPRIHVWENIALSRGSYSAQLMPRWWNATQSEQLQVIIVPTGDPPFMSTFPAGPVFSATYSPSSSATSPPAAADTSIVDSGVTRVNDVANQQASKKASSGRAAAGVLIPLILIALAVAAYVRWKRLREHQKRKAWTEKVDKRMSTISTDWKSVSAAGAQAAIRNSIAVASRNSSFSFGAIRPNSSFDTDPDTTLTEKSVRTGTGVGLRNPNALSSAGRNSTTSTRVSRVSFAPDPRVSRVSFADSTSDRKTLPSRAFHSAYIPPVPALPDFAEKDALSPRQTAGPLSLTPDDIKVGVAATKGSVSGLDEFLPALSLMRTGNMESSGPDDFLLPPRPEPAYTPTTASIAAAFPAPPTTNAVVTPNVVLSPDEMLRAYAERKKSLADAARAGKIGAPLRASGVPSIAASGVTSTSGSPSMSSGIRVETVSSIHATGMRVAYNNDDADGLSLPAPSVPSAYQPQLKPIRALSLSGKGIEGGKALIGKVKKNMGKKRKSMNPFAKAEPDPEASAEADIAETSFENPGDAYVAALEAEAAETEAQGQLEASRHHGDDVVGAYPFAYEQQYYGQYAGYEGQGEEGGYEYYAYQGEEAEGQQGKQQGGAYGY
jgi:hypothetical protein